MKPGNRAESRTTEDTLFGGAVRLLQPKAGYRVNADALILAAFAAHGRRPDLTLDLGAGVGAVALGLHYLGAGRRFALVDRDRELLGLARRNLAAAGAPGECWCVDLERAQLPEPLWQSADLVTANPPFFDPRRARGSLSPAKRTARFGPLEPFLRAAARALDGARARAAFVYPAQALPELLAQAHAAGLVPKRLRLVHARVETPARLALAELRHARPGGLQIEPPLIEWSAPGRRSEELSALLDGSSVDRR